MISDVYTEKHGIASILTAVDKIGKFCDLSPSAAGKLRLLTEEMLGLTVRLFKDLKYEFFMENSGRHFTLNLTAEAFISRSKKEKMLSLSKDGKNKAEQGLFGKISGVFEAMLTNSGELERIPVPYYDGTGMVSYFLLSDYRNGITETSDEELWDGLEKSIIANLAKDVVIGVRNDKAKMIVTVEL